ncbi:MAG: endonuclease III [Bacteroidetes bacterium]|jgi:endonuclease-3|nr:endonuclease III [Bacteroidota bacterium]
MRRKEKALQVLERLRIQNPSPETELHYRNAYELLVAVALSAQCTDKRVNLVTPDLFRHYPTPQALAAATVEEIFGLIRSISYPNNKARHLKAMAELLVQQYGSEVPADRDELVKLPGVGRKTANVILAVLYQQAAMPVDTHVFRVSNRLGLVKATNVAQAEKQLLAIVPDAQMHNAHHWLILHGRYTCKARKPSCSHCPLTDLCTWYAQNHPAKPAEKAKRPAGRAI